MTKNKPMTVFASGYLFPIAAFKASHLASVLMHMAAGIRVGQAYTGR